MGFVNRNLNTTIIDDLYSKEYKTSIQWLGAQSIVGFDIETTGLNPLQDKTLLIQIGTNERQYVYDIAKINDISDLLETLKSPQIVKIGHNIKFDYKFIKQNFQCELENLRCTLLGHALLEQGRPEKNTNLDLGSTVGKFLNLFIDKKQQTTFENLEYGALFTEEQLTYAAYDVLYLVPLYEEIHNKLIASQLDEIAELEWKVISITGDMELNGIYIDKKKWLKLKDLAQSDADKYRKKLGEYFEEKINLDLFGEPTINYNSPDQIKKYFSEIVGFELESTSKQYLESLKDKYPIIEDLLLYRFHTKRISTYGEEFLKKHIDPYDERIHSSFLQLGTDSGRYASRNPNLQNIPNSKAYREPFCVQSPDYKIISADFSGQELRLLAHISKEPEFINGIKTGKDLHAYSASLLFNIPYEDFFDEKGKIIPEMKSKYRNPAKTITFGLMYGMGVGKLAGQLKIDFNEARKLKDKYFEVFPKIKQLMNRLENDLLKNHYAYSPLDKRRVDFSFIDWDDKRKIGHPLNVAKNLPFQGAGASVTKLALVYINNKLKKQNIDARILLTVHDEIVLEVYKDEVEKMKKIVETEMIRAFNHYAPSVAMEVDAEVGDYWIH